MEINSSQKNLTNGLNELSADKKVWTKPAVEMISHGTVASGQRDGVFPEASYIPEFSPNYS